MEKNLQLDKRVSGRSKKMGLSAKPEFCEKLRSLSFYEKCLQIEILEEALELYIKSKKTKQQNKNIYQLLGVNNSQEIQNLLVNQTLPQLVFKINDLTYKLNIYQQTIPAIEKQMQPLLGSMSLMELEAKINFLTSIYFNKIGLTTTYEVLRESLSEFLKIKKERKIKKKSPIFKTKK